MALNRITNLKGSPVRVEFNLIILYMNKQRLDLEYPLSGSKPELLWRLISTDHGLERWIADKVDESDGIISLTWGSPWAEHHTLEARILEREKHSHIRLQWVDEDEPEAFWEMRIGRSELTEQLCLQVIDYAVSDDIEALHALWDGNLERLHQSSGL